MERVILLNLMVLGGSVRTHANRGTAAPLSANNNIQVHVLKSYFLWVAGSAPTEAPACLPPLSDLCSRQPDSGRSPRSPSGPCRVERSGPKLQPNIRPQIGCGTRLGSIGIDISKHRPGPPADLDDSSFHVIVILSPEAYRRALEMTRTMAVNVEYCPTFDASLMVGQCNREQALDADRQVRDFLYRKVKQRFGCEGGPAK